MSIANTSSLFPAVAFFNGLLSCLTHKLALPLSVLQSVKLERPSAAQCVFLHLIKCMEISPKENQKERKKQKTESDTTSSEL